MVPRVEDLVQSLRDARRIELELLEGLTEPQMLGSQAHFIEPPIWETGHVGWFQEFWIRRHLDGQPTLLPGSDGIYDAFNVAYTRRWDHRYPSRARTLEYISEILERTVGRLDSREPTPTDVYFYTLAALHEGMHAENLTLIRQTLRERSQLWVDSTKENVCTIPTLREPFQGPPSAHETLCAELLPRESEPVGPHAYATG